MKKTIVAILFLWGFSFNNYTFSQEESSKILSVSLKNQEGYGPLPFSSRFPYLYKEDLDRFNGIPTDLDTFALWGLTFQREQFLFQYYQSGKINESDLRKLLGLNINLNNFSPNPIKESVFILTGLKGSEKLIIVDQNQNKNFEDDPKYVFNISHLEKVFSKNAKLKTEDYFAYRDTMPTLRVQFQYYYQGKIMLGYQHVKIIPFNYSVVEKDVIQKKLEVYLESFEHYTGDFFLPSGKQLKLATTKGPNALFSSRTTEFSICEYKENFKDLKIPNNKGILVGEEWFIDSFKIKIAHIDPIGKSLELEITRLDSIGSRAIMDIGSKAPPYIHTYMGEGQFDLYNDKAPYILMDFWGSWCSPCIKAMPKIQEFYRKYKSDNWSLVGIAVDKEPKLIQEVVKSMYIPWKQIFINQYDQKDVNQFIEVFDVESFPTYILLGPDRKILDLGGSKDLDRILSLLQQKIE